MNGTEWMWTLHGGGWMWLMHAGWMLLWIGLAAAFFFLPERRARPVPVESPLDLLTRRYAEGGLSTEEFEERRSHLS